MKKEVILCNYIMKGNSLLKIINSEFRFVSSTFFGGSIFAEDYSIFLEQNKFLNSTSQSGNVLYLSGNSTSASISIIKNQISSGGISALDLISANPNVKIPELYLNYYKVPKRIKLRLFEYYRPLIYLSQIDKDFILNHPKTVIKLF